MTLDFGHPWIYLSILPIMALWYIFGREKIGYRAPNPIIAKYLKKPKSIIMLWSIRMIIVTCLVSTIVSVSLTQVIVKKVPVKNDIMLILDLSLSMLAEDIRPNRIESAKQMIKNFISGELTSRIGLIIFAGKPFVSVSFSTDVSGINHLISSLSPYSIRQDQPGLSGTNIGDALLLGSMSFSGSNNPHKSIILITDGRANIGMDPLESARILREQGITLSTIGIGSEGHDELYYTDSTGKRIYFYDENGKPIQSDLDIPLLKKLAEIGGGSFFRATDRVGIQRAFGHITDTLASETTTEQRIERYDLTLGLICIIVILIMAERYTYAHILRRYRLT